ncbi:MAG TPA: CheR family methyltransferase, partial [Bacteroidales bacterium]|nr:CheR family methyltransferase [Bacteroidales bacterium]
PDEDIKLFLESLRSASNYDFSNYSVNSLKRRLRKLLTDNHLDITHLVQKIEEDWAFMEKVVKSITVTTTEFFRDPSIWLSLKENIFPLYSGRKKVSIWIAGCSTGQEVYSLMILLSEAGLLNKTELFATDINTDVLKVAERGIYKYRFNKDYLTNFDEVINHGKTGKKMIPYSKYFEVDEQRDTITMGADLTRRPLYRKTDLVRDENPFDKEFDIIICRNVIIYFNYELQNKVLNTFYHRLNSEGWLLLGIHESIIGTYSSYFEKKFHLYKKR